MEEIWKEIKGFDYHLISNLGRIKSLPRGIKKKETILKQSDNGRGYMKVCIREKGKMTNKYIHRLVAEAFIYNTMNKREVNHKNGIRVDNRVENLEWVTYSENNLHAYKTKLKIPNYKKVYCINNNKVYASLASAAKELGLYKQHISAVCRKKINSTKGYRFEYL